MDLTFKQVCLSAKPKATYSGFVPLDGSRLLRSECTVRTPEMDGASVTIFWAGVIVLLMGGMTPHWNNWHSLLWKWAHSRSHSVHLANLLPKVKLLPSSPFCLTGLWIEVINRDILSGSAWKPLCCQCVRLYASLVSEQMTGLFLGSSGVILTYSGVRMAPKVKSLPLKQQTTPDICCCSFHSFKTLRLPCNSKHVYSEGSPTELNGAYSLVNVPRTAHACYSMYREQHTMG